MKQQVKPRPTFETQGFCRVCPHDKKAYGQDDKSFDTELGKSKEQEATDTYQNKQRFTFGDFILYKKVALCFKFILSIKWGIMIIIDNKSKPIPYRDSNK